VELLVPGVEDFETVRWKTVWKVRDPSNKMRNSVR
jgi:hypothetical protein